MLTSCPLLVLALTATAVAAEPPTFLPASAMVRIGGVEGAHPTPADAWRLAMARGEREGFQFALVAADEVAVRAVTVHAADPRAPGATLSRVLAVDHVTPRPDPVWKVPPRRLGLVPTC